MKAAVSDLYSKIQECSLVTEKVSLKAVSSGHEVKQVVNIVRVLLGLKGIKREYSNARTPQQNGVAERKNRTLIKAARTMLADSFLPNTFWAEAVSTACYVLNRFDGKSNEGFLVGYSLQSKAFRVYNLETKRVEENLHITFLENKPNVARKGPTWLFDLDYLTDSMNYQPVTSENQANKHAGLKEANHNVGTEDNINAGDSKIEAESAQDYFVLPIWSSYTSTIKSSKEMNAGEEPNKHPDLKTNEKPVDKEDQVFLDELERLKREEQDANDASEALRKEFAQDTEDLLLQTGAAKASSTNIVNTSSTPVSTASPYGGLSFTDLTNTDQDDSEIPALKEIYNNPTDGIFTNASYDDEGAVAHFTNLKTIVNILIDLPYGKKAIGTKWVNRNKKDKRGVVVRNKARIEAIRIFLAFASYMGFIVYQMDVKSAFLYGKIDEENGYRRGTIDKTLFIKKDKNDIMLVQVYVDAVVELTLQVTINNGRRREVKYRQSQEVLVDIPERITEHGLSSEITQSPGKRAARGPSQAAKALPQDPEPTQVIADRYVTEIMLSVDGVLGKDQSSDCVFSLQFELWPCNESTAYKTHDALDVNVNTINLVAISCNTDGYVAVVSPLQGPMILPYLADLNLARER
ncbi:putative ribonuclease H-like domain-containing protein [Tanacetum coccineum]